MEGDQVLLAFAPGSDRLAYRSSREPELRVLDAATGDEVLSFDLPAGGSSEPVYLAFSPDGKWIATNRGSGVSVFGVETKRELVAFPKEVGPRTGSFVNCVAFSPDGRELAMGFHASGFLADGVYSTYSTVRFVDLSLVLAPAEEVVERVERKTGLRLEGVRAVAPLSNHLERVADGSR